MKSTSTERFMYNFTSFPTAAPKPSQATSRDLTNDEKAALWDEAQALHDEARAAQVEIDKLRFKAATLQSKRDALYELNRPVSVKTEACSLCGMERGCVCERLG